MVFKASLGYLLLLFTVYGSCYSYLAMHATNSKTQVEVYKSP